MSKIRLARLQSATQKQNSQISVLDGKEVIFMS